MSDPTIPLNVWQAVATYKQPVVYLHEHAGQPQSCLEGLVHYAARIAQNKRAYAYRTPAQIITWLWQQPVVLDLGEGPTSPGCFPAQRSRIWPDCGLDCWEATAHLLGVAFCHQWLMELHIFDAAVRGQRHVFPAVRPLYHFNDLPEPLVIQPPIHTGKNSHGLRYAAQAWYNDVLGGLHIVGDKVLRVFGAGDLSDEMSKVQGNELPDWARTAKQREQRAAQLIKQAAVRSNPPSLSSKSMVKPNLPTEPTQSIATDSDNVESLKKQVAQLTAENAALKARSSPKGASQS